MAMAAAVGQPVSVVIVGSEWEHREALVRLLRAAADLEVTAATSVENALESAEKRPSDVFVCDIDVLDSEPIAVLTELRTRHPDIPCVVITRTRSLEVFGHAIACGARAYLLKDDAGRLPVVDAVRAVGNGAYYFYGTGIDGLLSGFVGEMHTPGAPYGLTVRELEVLELMAAGSPNKLISRELSITDQAVKNLAVRIFRKLGVTNRTEAALLAVREGIVRAGTMAIAALAWISLTL